MTGESREPASGDAATRFVATCACGAANVAIAGPVKIHAVCHCANCRRRTGSAFGWSAYFPREALQPGRGALAAYALETPSSGVPQVRFFCGRCGSTLYWLDEKFPTLVGVAAGCLAPSPGEPSISASDGQRCAWVGLPGTWRVFRD